MKKIIILNLIALFSVATLIHAQTKSEGTRTEVDSATGKTYTVTYTEVKKEEDVTPRSNMIVINPLKFFLFYNLSFYHKLSPTVIVGGGFQMPTSIGSYFGGYGFNAEIRLYPSQKAMRGFYVAPNVSYTRLSASDYLDSYSAHANLFSLGALLGWQWFVGDDFAIGLGLGLDYYIFSGGDNNGSFDFGSYSNNRTYPSLRFDIGYAW